MNERAPTVNPRESEPTAGYTETSPEFVAKAIEIATTSIGENGIGPWRTALREFETGDQNALSVFGLTDSGWTQEAQRLLVREVEKPQSLGYELTQFRDLLQKEPVVTHTNDSSKNSLTDGPSRDDAWIDVGLQNGKGIQIRFDAEKQVFIASSGGREIYAEGSQDLILEFLAREMETPVK